MSPYCFNILLIVSISPAIHNMFLRSSTSQFASLLYKFCQVSWSLISWQLSLSLLCLIYWWKQWRTSSSMGVISTPMAGWVWGQTGQTVNGVTAGMWWASMVGHLNGTTLLPNCSSEVHWVQLLSIHSQSLTSFSLSFWKRRRTCNGNGQQFFACYLVHRCGRFQLTHPLSIRELTV